MITQTTAIVRDGVLHPEEPLKLPNETRVGLTIRTSDVNAERLAARSDFLSWIENHPLHLGIRTWTRDDLYDRD
jgi:hypothetical protein